LTLSEFVIPAQAGIQWVYLKCFSGFVSALRRILIDWIPACAGMTVHLEIVGWLRQLIDN
jgi:hypothetical protein